MRARVDHEGNVQSPRRRYFRRHPAQNCPIDVDISDIRLWNPDNRFLEPAIPRIRGWKFDYGDAFLTLMETRPLFAPEAITFNVSIGELDDDCCTSVNQLVSLKRLEFLELDERFLDSILPSNLEELVVGSLYIDGSRDPSTQIANLCSMKHRIRFSVSHRIDDLDGLTKDDVASYAVDLDLRQGIPGFIVIVGEGDLNKLREAGLTIDESRITLV